jgi:hypothetical protein
MQRLTLILSDLYVPEERVPGALPRTEELPALSGLLRVARQPEYVDDWRHWLLREVGGPDLSQAAICAAERIDGADLQTAWLATPVALEARLDHVRMQDRGLLHINAAERTAWCAEFNRVFAPQYSLHDGGERAFILAGLDAATTTTDPARLLGAEIGPALPGADAPELRRLWTEIEMWLHGSALNDARERAREPRLSALWLWGRNTGTTGARVAEHRDIDFHGGDPLIAGLARARASQVRAAPRTLAHILGARRHAHVVVEFAVVTGSPQESLAELDTHWFGPAREALASGALSLLEIVANDRCFRVTRAARWRFWRSRRGWLEILAHPAGNPRV